MPLLPQNTDFNKPEPRPVDPIIAERRKAARLRAETAKSFQQQLDTEEEVALNSRFGDRGTVFPARSAVVGTGKSLASGVLGLTSATLDTFGFEGAADSVAESTARFQGELEALNFQSAIERERQSGGNELGGLIGETFTDTARSSLTQAAGGKLGKFVGGARKGSEFLGMVTTASTEAAGNQYLQSRLSGANKTEAKQEAAITFGSEFIITAIAQKAGFGGLEKGINNTLKESLKKSIDSAIKNNKSVRNAILKEGARALRGGGVQTFAELIEETAIPIVDDSLSSLLVGVTREEFGTPEFLADLQKKTDKAIQQTLAQMALSQGVRSRQAIKDLIGTEVEVRADLEQQRQRLAQEEAAAAEQAAAQETADNQSAEDSFLQPVQEATELDTAIDEDSELRPLDVGDGVQIRSEQEAQTEAEARRKETEDRVKAQVKNIRTVDLVPEGMTQKDVNTRLDEVSQRVQDLVPEGTVTREGNAIILTDKGGSRTAFMLMSPEAAAADSAGTANSPARRNIVSSLKSRKEVLVDDNNQPVSEADFLKMGRDKAAALLARNNAVQGWMMNNPRGGRFPVDADSLIALTDPNAILEEYHHKLVANQLEDSEIKAAAQHLNNLGRLQNADRSVNELLEDADFMENLAADYMQWRNDKLNPTPTPKAKRPGVIRRMFERIFRMFSSAKKAAQQQPVHPLQELNEAILSGEVSARPRVDRGQQPQVPDPFAKQAEKEQKAADKETRAALSRQRLSQQAENAPRIAKLKEQRLAAQDKASQQKQRAQALRDQRQDLQQERQALGELKTESQFEQQLEREAKRLDKKAETALKEDLRLERMLQQEEAQRDKAAERELAQEERLLTREAKQEDVEQRRVDRQNVDQQRREQQQRRIAQGERRLAVAEQRLQLQEAKVAEKARRVLVAEDAGLNEQQREFAGEVTLLQDDIDVLQEAMQDPSITPERRAEMQADIDTMKQRIQGLDEQIPDVEEGGAKLFSIRANPAATPESRQAMKEMQDAMVPTRQSWEQADQMGEDLLQTTRHKDLINEWENLVENKDNNAQLDDVAQSALRLLIERANAVIADPNGRNKDAMRIRLARLMAIDVRQGTKAGRALAARRDRILTPEQRRAELHRLMTEPPPNILSKVRALQNRGNFKEASNVLREWNQKELVKTMDRLAAAGIDLDSLPDDDLTQDRFFQIRGEIIAARIKITGQVAMGLANQFAYNQLLSPISSGKALFGNLVFSSLIGTNTVVEATVNELVKMVRGKGIKGAADLATVRAGLTAFVHSIGGALRNGVYTAFTGRSRAQERLGFADNTFEQQEGFSDPIDALTSNPIGKGFLRATIGLNTSLLVGVDEVMNTIVSNTMVAAAAARQASEQGLTGSQVTEFVKQASQDPMQMLDEKILINIKKTTDQIALRSDFEQESDPLFASEKAANKVKKAAQLGENLRNFSVYGFRPFQLVIPFYRTIANSIIESSRYAPITSAANAFIKAHDAVKARGTELSDEANLELLKQGVRLSVMAAIIAAIEGMWDGEDEDESAIQGTKGRQFSIEQKLEARLGRENTVAGRDISQLDPLGSALIDYANTRDAVTDKGLSADALWAYANNNFEVFFRRPFGDNVIKFIETPKEEFVGGEVKRRTPLTGDFAGIGRTFDAINAEEIRSRRDDAPIRDMFGDSLKRREDTGTMSTIAALGGVTDVDDLKGDKRAWAIALLEAQPIARELDGKGVIPGGVLTPPKGVEDVDKYRQLKGQRFFDLLQRIGDPETLEINARTIKRLRRANRESTSWAKRRAQ